MAGGILALFVLCAPLPASAASCIKAAPVFEFTTGGTTPLRQPADIALSPDRLFVLDDLNGRIAVYDLDGRYRSSIKLPGGSGVPYLGLDIGGDDNLYLAAPGKGKVVVIGQSGSVVREFETGGDDGPSEPVGINVARGTCFVVDNEAHRIRSFDLEGTPLEAWGGLGEGADRFRYPFRVIQDNLGRVIVTDTLNSRVKIFTPKGEPLLDFGEFGVTEGTLFRPAGLGLWGEDLLLVSDNYLGSVQLFDVQGKFRAVLCGTDGTPLLFQNPVSIAVRERILYVLEMGANRIRGLKIMP